MAIKRKLRSRRRRLRRKARILRTPRPSRNMLQTKRLYELTAVDTNGSAAGLTYPLAAQFKLSFLPGYPEFQGLFDEYCIKAVKYRWVIDVDRSNNNIASHFVRVWDVVDINDSTTPVGTGDLAQYPGCKCQVLTREKPLTPWRYFKPRYVKPIFNDTAGTAYTGARGFLDTAFPQIPHYGVKAVIQDVPADVKVYLQVWLYLTFRGVR